MSLCSNTGPFVSDPLPITLVIKCLSHKMAVNEALKVVGYSYYKGMRGWSVYCGRFTVEGVVLALGVENFPFIRVLSLLCFLVSRQLVFYSLLLNPQGIFLIKHCFYDTRGLGSHKKYPKLGEKSKFTLSYTHSLKVSS